MKCGVLLLAAMTLVFKINAQETIVFENQERRVVVTGIPFVLLAADSRAASMGDMGVATSVDAFSQQWNASKYVFSENKSGIAVSYTPYLNKLVNDIFLGNVTYFNKLDSRSSFAASLRYFSLGDIVFITEAQAQQSDFQSIIERPNELTLDASYALRLSDRFGMSVAMRYLRSDLKLSNADEDASAANTFGVDVSGYYQSEEKSYSNFNGRWRMGFAIQNIGPKFKYDQGGQDNFQPTILRLGGGFDFILNDYNKIALTAEVSKLLVPSPPLYGFKDTDGDKQQDSDEPTIIVAGKNPDVNFLSGIFQSFSDAPDGFSEEIREFIWALGVEYSYQNSFAFRTGYFNESEDKGSRKFIALGAGFKYKVANIDLSYLFSTSKIQSPLENTLRFSLTFNIGEGRYSDF